MTMSKDKYFFYLNKIFFIALCIFPLMISGAEPPSTKAPEKKQQASPIPGQPETSEEISPSVPTISTENYEHAFVKMLLTLFGLIVLIFLTIWMLRRLSSGRLHRSSQMHTIQILAKRPLSAKTVLYLIEIENKRVLVAESQLEVRTLTSSENIPSSEE
jgi:flagellar biogenesis protein FliO